ncbi:hypothetical protein D3C80_1869580 [compost metagenome]
MEGITGLLAMLQSIRNFNGCWYYGTDRHSSLREYRRSNQNDSNYRSHTPIYQLRGIIPARYDGCYGYRPQHLS